MATKECFFVGRTVAGRWPAAWSGRGPLRGLYVGNSTWIPHQTTQHEQTTTLSAAAFISAGVNELNRIIIIWDFFLQRWCNWRRSLASLHHITRVKNLRDIISFRDLWLGSLNCSISPLILTTPVQNKLTLSPKRERKYYHDDIPPVKYSCRVCS